MSDKPRTDLASLKLGEEFDRFAALEDGIDTAFAKGMAAIQTGEPVAREQVKIVHHIGGFGRPG